MRNALGLALVSTIAASASGCLPRVEWRDGGEAGTNDIVSDRADVATDNPVMDVQSELVELDATPIEDVQAVEVGPEDVGVCDDTGPCATTATVIGPLSGSVTAGPPLLRFSTSSGTNRADIVMCHDRALTDCPMMFTATSPFRPPISAGTWFWRVRANTAGVVGVTWSATWEMFVSSTGTTGATIASVPDVNGDGLGDAIVGSITAGTLDVAYGAATLPSFTMPVTIMTQADMNSHSWLAHCDVNGDGFVDVIVGAANGGGGTGAAYAIAGGPSGLGAAVAIPNVASSGDKFGFSVACAGDVNHDGYGDVAIGSPGANSGDGRVEIVLGPLTATPTRIPPPTPGQLGGFGASIAGNADINGDGDTDLVIGEPYFSSNSGRSLVMLGSPTGLVPDTSGTGVYTQGGSNHFTGLPVAFVGDVDGDGRADYGVSSVPYMVNGQVHLVRSGGAAVELSGPPGFGTGVAGSDVNHDGLWDVIVGSPAESSAEGRLYRYIGSGLTSPPPSPLPWITGSAAVGTAIAFVGDMTGDGTLEFLAGAPSGTGNVLIFSDPGAYSGVSSGLLSPSAPRTNSGTALAH